MGLPAQIFSIANLLAMIAWLALLASLPFPSIRPVTNRLATIAVPLLLAFAYAALLVGGGPAPDGGGFGSIVEVRALFADDAMLTAGWIHYLAFDLFVGGWIARDAARRSLPWWLLPPCLILCFLFGPTGLLAYMLLRMLLGRRTAA
ncbi:ABA4-like family protein [Rhizorhabdus phycosphaerae]|uniref:ABA4-like family protein n=1 Tax=Rhizorhabdus phycosphaerae TaxID=2711156 RepID=UPI0013EA6A23|nr:ABA4-like family protein [Rhizorhabdus phycosphaerae]